MTALHRNAKSCTALLCDGIASDPFVDLGPEEESLVDIGGGYAEEAASARTAIDAPRAVTMWADATTGATGTLLRHGNAASYGYRVKVAAGVIECAENGALRISAHLPDLGIAAQRYVIHWAQRIEGAQVRSELVLMCLATGAVAWACAEHPAGTTNQAHTLSFGGGWAGADLFTGSAGAGGHGYSELPALRIGRRFVSSTEAVNDFAAESVPETTTGERRRPMLTAPANELRIAGAGDMTGPQYLRAAAATREAQARAIGPFVNVVPTRPALETPGLTPSAWYRASPDIAGAVLGWVWCLRYLFHGYVSPRCNALRVRVHVKRSEADGGATTTAVELRAYSASYVVPKANEPAIAWRAGPVVSIEKPAADWYDLGIVRISREPSGLSYLVLGHRWLPGAGEGVAFHTRFQIQAITAEPLVANFGGGGFGDVDEKDG